MVKHIQQVCAMITIVFVLCLIGLSSAEDSDFKLKCSVRENANATMQPSDDGFNGRYTTQVCIQMKPNVTKWTLDLTYNNRAHSCNKTHHSIHPGIFHTNFAAEGIGEDIKSLNCTHVCLVTNMDMVFRSCYLLKSVLHTENGIQFQPYDSYFNITNQYTLEDFNKTPEISIISREKDTTTIIFYGQIKPNKYSVDLVYMNKSTSVGNVDVTDNCTAGADSMSVQCAISTGEGCYKVWLRNEAPWSALLDSQRLVTKDWCRQAAARVRGAVDWSAAWGCGAAALLLAAAALLWRRRDHAHLHKRVLRYWTEHRHSSRSGSAERACVGAVCEGCGVCEGGAAGAGGAGSAAGDSVRVLLLYARECERGQKLVAALRDLLQQHQHVQVQDLFSAECMRVAGAAPHAWVQRALASHRVLVLQTPALAALYAPRRPSDSHTCSPLLGQGAVYRTPHYGDTLLQYALRLLADDAAHPQPYRKYYLATLSGAETELFPGVVPFRRYVLPPAAAVLLRDVTGDDVTAAAAHADTARLQRAADEFVAFVRLHPDYLADELLLT